MKSITSSRLNDALFKKGSSEQPVRLIKAAQASKLLGGLNGHSHGNSDTDAPKKPEIRMIHSGADYCDLEVTCSCGETTQVRCWNTPAKETKAAA